MRFFLAILLSLSLWLPVAHAQTITSVVQTRVHPDDTDATKRVLVVIDGFHWQINHRVPAAVLDANVAAWLMANVPLADRTDWSARATVMSVTSASPREGWKRKTLGQNDLKAVELAIIAAMVKRINVRFVTAGLTPLTNAEVITQMQKELDK